MLLKYRGIPYRADSSSSRPNLIARWELENGKLVCRWIIVDRPPIH
jgi:hypothetical protein